MKTAKILSLQEAVALVENDSRLLAGGFGMTGNPVHLLNALAETSVKGLTYIGNNVGEPNLGGGRLLERGKIKKMIGSFFTSNPDAVLAAQNGDVEYEIIPQGTLAEAIRAGGVGIGGFYTPTAAGTMLANGKDSRIIDGVEQVFMEAITADIAFIRAWKADTAGNLVYRLTEQNFNSSMAMAAKTVIVEVEEIVPVGTLDPNHIHTQGCFVDYLVQCTLEEKDLGSSASIKGSSKKVDDVRLRIANRVLHELSKGDVVNLGIGIPTLVADLIKPEDGIILHTENGMLGVGPEPEDGAGALVNPVNAGKVPVTALKGASYFDSTISFGMIRGKHVDIAVMGGLQVDENANLANWAVPGKPLLGVGGAMDLASGAKKLIVTMQHCNKDGSSKIVSTCSLPLTAIGSVDMIITELAVFSFRSNKLILNELMPGVELEEVRAKTEASFVVELEGVHY
ncbi:MAG: 3-oxoacid CoA-transferase subunit B [Flavobacteriia bacterium]|nr:3-oxoacid CoA-transferase subunit B [Flavobacteriia bacterium]